MDALTYGLSQRIGVFYKDEEWFDKIFFDFVNHYPEDWFIDRGIHKLKFSGHLELKDGTTIEFIKAQENFRGCCFSKIIIQPDIDEEIINCIIRPTLKHQNRYLMVLKDNDRGLYLDWQ